MNVLGSFRIQCLSPLIASVLVFPFAFGIVAFLVALTGMVNPVPAAEVKLTASDAAIGDYFGCFVSLSGHYAIVGAYTFST